MIWNVAALKMAIFLTKKKQDEGQALKYLHVLFTPTIKAHLCWMVNLVVLLSRLQISATLWRDTKNSVTDRRENGGLSTLSGWGMAWIKRQNNILHYWTFSKKSIHAIMVFDDEIQKCFTERIYVFIKYLKKTVKTVNMTWKPTNQRQKAWLMGCQSFLVHSAGTLTTGTHSLVLICYLKLQELKKENKKFMKNPLLSWPMLACLQWKC